MCDVDGDMKCVQLTPSKICTGSVCPSFKIGNALVDRRMDTVVAWGLAARLGYIHDKQLVTGWCFLRLGRHCRLGCREYVQVEQAKQWMKLE